MLAFIKIKIIQFFGLIDILTFMQSVFLKILSFNKMDKKLHIVAGCSNGVSKIFFGLSVSLEQLGEFD